MLRRRTWRTPRGTRRIAFTLVEVLITLALSALVLGLAVSVGARLQHRLLAESTRLAVDEQLASAAQLVPLDLRAASPVAGGVVGARGTPPPPRAAAGAGGARGGAGKPVFFGAYPRARPRGRAPPPPPRR